MIASKRTTIRCRGVAHLECASRLELSRNRARGGGMLARTVLKPKVDGTSYGPPHATLGAGEFGAASIGSMADSRGLDGLTTEELAESRRGWWDDAFTQTLLRCVPRNAGTLLDVGSGVCTAAHALLPKLPDLRYVGVDADRHRLDAAQKLLAGVPFRDRVELREARAESLPFADGDVDVVLMSMTLQHLPDPPAAVREVARVLAPAGTFIGIEPDHTANHVYFDGVLDDVNAALRAVFEAQRRHRRPADTAIGPALAKLAEQAGLEVVEFSPYLISRARKTTSRQFFAGMAAFVDVLARDLPADAREVESCRAVLARSESGIEPTTSGYESHVVPAFICVARKT